MWTTHHTKQFGRRTVRPAIADGAPAPRAGSFSLTVRFHEMRDGMAAPRKSAQQVAAREKARQKAADFTARHEELIELAAKFIELDEAANNTETAAQEKAQRIIAQGKVDAEAARKESGRVIAQMIKTGESKSAVAARLGLSAATLKKYLPTPGSAAKDSEPSQV